MSDFFRSIDAGLLEVQELLSTIESTLQEDRLRAALLHLVRFVDTKFREGEFQTCDMLLEVAKLETFPPELLVGLLRITFSARDKLAHWPATFQRIEKRLEALNYDPSGLLAGLSRPL